MEFMSGDDPIEVWDFNTTLHVHVNSCSYIISGYLR